MIDWVIGGIIVLIISSLFIGEPCDRSEQNDNAVFTVQEGQSITIGDGNLEFYDEEKNITFIHDAYSGELINQREGK